MRRSSSSSGGGGSKFYSNAHTLFAVLPARPLSSSPPRLLPPSLSLAPSRSLFLSCEFFTYLLACPPLAPSPPNTK